MYKKTKVTNIINNEIPDELNMGQKCFSYLPKLECIKQFPKCKGKILLLLILYIDIL